MGASRLSKPCLFCWQFVIFLHKHSNYNTFVDSYFINSREIYFPAHSRMLEQTWISTALILRPSQVLGKCGFTLFWAIQYTWKFSSKLWKAITFLCGTYQNATFQQTRGKRQNSTVQVQKCSFRFSLEWLVSFYTEKIVKEPVGHVTFVNSEHIQQS